jgi:hypothetical protein
MIGPGMAEGEPEEPYPGLGVENGIADQVHLGALGRARHFQELNTVADGAERVT